MHSSERGCTRLHLARRGKNGGKCERGLEIEYWRGLLTSPSPPKPTCRCLPSRMGRQAARVQLAFGAAIRSTPMRVGALRCGPSNIRCLRLLGGNPGPGNLQNERRRGDSRTLETSKSCRHSPDASRTETTPQRPDVTLPDLYQAPLDDSADSWIGRAPRSDPTSPGHARRARSRSYGRAPSSTKTNQEVAVQRPRSLLLR